MCKQLLRRIKKAEVLKFIALWEIGYWMFISGVIIIAYLYREENTNEEYLDLQEQYGYDSEELREKVRTQYLRQQQEWQTGLWIHLSCASLYVPIAAILYVGVHNRNRAFVALWIVLYILNSAGRMWALFAMSTVYRWLLWHEFYWFVRVFFLLVAIEYNLDLWSDEFTAEEVDIPQLLPLDDPRPYRGALNYPEYPLTLDQKQRVFGIGRSLPMHVDYRFISHPMPTWYETKDDRGKDTLVVDVPPYLSDS